jgi:hypothetical protein
MPLVSLELIILAWDLFLTVIFFLHFAMTCHVFLQLKHGPLGLKLSHEFFLPSLHYTTKGVHVRQMISLDFEQIH